MSAVKERPILFSAPMVRAILEGRKTVTRRALNAQALKNIGYGVQLGECHELPSEGPLHPNSIGYYNDFCPYGQPGERLWVRETWGVISHDFDEHGNMIDWKPDRPASAIREMRFGRGYYSGHVIYRADGEATWASDDEGGGDDRSSWKPSIHMPRIASRILLEITDVRVERLQDISEDQAMSEGVDTEAVASFRGSGVDRPAGFAFRDLWISINDADAWDANPWVWVVEFKQVTP